MTSSSSADSGGCVVGRPPASASASSFPVRRLASIALVVMAFAVSIANVMIGHRDASSSSSSSAVAAAPSSAIDKPRRSISRIRQRSEEEGGGGPIEEGRRKAEDDDDRRRSRLTGGTEESDHHHHHHRRRRDENDDDGLLVVDGDLVTRILLGEVPFPSASGSGSGSGTRGSSRIRYLPGTLRLSHAEALRRCYVNETIYSGHLSDRPQSLVSLSDEHKLIYRNNPKSSSSSARHAMQDFLSGRDHRMKHDDLEEKVHEGGYSMISFVRDPLSRFYSSYDEAYFRMGPWMGHGPIVDDKPRVKHACHDNKWKVEKYPYLYEGMYDIQDFRVKFCPRELLRRGRFLDCNNVPSIDDGDLVGRFERFVRDYSGLDPFDIHLNLQVSNLVFTTGEPFPFTALYNSTEADKGWQEIARERGVEIPDGEMTHGRKISRRFDPGMVSVATKRKICRILALDYCCLNIELPGECSSVGENDDDGEAVYCAAERRNDETMRHALESMVIHPWRDP